MDWPATFHAIPFLEKLPDKDLQQHSAPFDIHQLRIHLLKDLSIP